MREDDSRTLAELQRRFTNRLAGITVANHTARTLRLASARGRKLVEGVADKVFESLENERPFVSKPKVHVGVNPQTRELIVNLTPPGALHSHELGCTCPVEDNEYGGLEDASWVVTPGCPLHDIDPNG